MLTVKLVHDVHSEDLYEAGHVFTKPVITTSPAPNGAIGEIVDTVGPHKTIAIYN